LQTREKGVLSPSETYFYTESDFAKSALFYGIAAGIYFCNEDYFVERKSFDSYLIILLKKGRMRVNYNNRQFYAKENDLIFLNCYKPHLYCAEEEVQFSFFHFDGNSSSKYFDLLFNKYGCVFPLYESNPSPKLIHQVIEVIKNNINDEHFISMTIHKILYELFLVTNSSKRMLDEQIRNAILYIENHFTEEITLETLSQRINLSVYHFTRLFKKYTGSSPYQYILDHRINYSKKLLHTTNDSIENIAFASGFNSLSHFTTTFKKRIKLTPNQFRRIQF